MGKYMRKSKKSGEVSPLGVLTRAKTLALQKLNNNNTTKATAVSPAGTGSGGDGGSYLQLRSRRLVKPFSVLDGGNKKSKDPDLLNPNPKQRNSDEGKNEPLEAKENENSCSFGENLLEFDGRNRTTRESTPCSLIRDSDNIQTPGSTTRCMNANEDNSRVASLMRTVVPTAHEMDEFFSRAEKQQQKEFIEKYNFDPVNEKPLPGRYEWVKVDC